MTWKHVKVMAHAEQAFSFFKSHNAFCKSYSTHTFICCAGWRPLPREGEGDRFVHFSCPRQDSRVKEALQLEGSSAPGICCQLFREWKVSPNDICLAAFSWAPAWETHGPACWNWRICWTPLRWYTLFSTLWPLEATAIGQRAFLTVLHSTVRLVGGATPSCVLTRSVRWAHVSAQVLTGFLAGPPPRHPAPERKDMSNWGHCESQFTAISLGMQQLEGTSPNEASLVSKATRGWPHDNGLSPGPGDN